MLLSLHLLFPVAAEHLSILGEYEKDREIRPCCPRVEMRVNPTLGSGKEKMAKQSFQNSGKVLILVSPWWICRTVDIQRCGNSWSISLARCVGRRVSTSFR